MAEHHISQYAADGALALHLGSTLEERRARTAPARAARAARAEERRRKPTMAERIAAAEALLPNLDDAERARQERWIAQAKANLDRRDDDQLVAS